MDINLFDLSGGINQGSTKTELGYNTKKLYWTDSKNIEIYDNKGIIRQKGNSLVVELPEAEAITGLAEMESDSNYKLVITTISGKIYIYSEINNSLTLLEKTLNGKNIIFTPFLRGIVIATEADTMFYIKDNSTFDIACQSGKWNFLLRRAKFILPPNTTEIDNNVNGRILYLFIDGKRYRFSENIEKFMEGSQNSGYYSSFHDKLLFPKFDKEKVIDVIYYSNNCVQEENGNEKTDFEDIKDCSLIPMPFVEQILVYGTCLRLKGNPQHFKFSYWMSMYKEALANLKSKTSVSVDNAPKVRLFRD